ncbi:MAG: putative hydroxypyruvate reductase [Chloroflexi bacterium ADurb.Bin180]|nr:MAG: putative hydroxypyruvate reductase [Chloroflexi bacterium ADurb.Bin180]
MERSDAFDLRAFDGLPPGSRGQVEEIARAALAAADPRAAVQRSLRLEGDVLWVCGRAYSLSEYQRVYVVGAGKASAAMAVAVEQVLGNRIAGGWVNVKDGYVASTSAVAIHEAGHPLPDERSVVGSRQIVGLVDQATERDLILCLISGGGSALMTLPVEGITLADMSALTGSLLRSGATINEMNAVRKHLEQLKGGQLARLASPATVIALILSDVIGSPLDVIASGPTSPDESTYVDALSVLRKYDLIATAPPSIVRHLERGAAGKVAETPKRGDRAFERVQNWIIASNEQAAEAAVAKARELGLHALLLSTFVEGEAREVARVLAGILREIDHSGRPLARPACLVAGGETTVTVRGSGLGGRNQELALAAVVPLAGLSNVALLSLGTDGSDGPTDAAGAMTTGLTASRAAARELEPRAFLANNDAYHFFQPLGDLIKTGPTNTNVNDLVLLFAW